VGLHGERRLQFAIPQNLYRVLGLDHAGLAQNVRRNGGLLQPNQLVQVHHRVFLAEDIREAALGQAAMQRHLAAFKTAQHARTAPRPLAFVAARRSLAHAGAHAASHPLALLRRLLRCSNVRQIHMLCFLLPEGFKVSRFHSFKVQSYRVRL